MAVSNVCWFVGATYNRNEDQLARFLADGLWEVRNPTANESALVRSMQPGERIAIKSTYVRKRGLPFDNRGFSVSVMAIKATGIIRSNPGDGERVIVDWATTPPLREWYFYTYRATIWRLDPGEWASDGLIAFAFDGATQDFARFRNAPYWCKRFGDLDRRDSRFGWTRFYEAVADKLLAYRHDRAPLVAGIAAIARRIDAIGYLGTDTFANGESGFVRDICPFTVMGTFNRGITDANRKTIAGELANFLGVTEAIPDSFEGIPLLNNMKSWFFPFEDKRDNDHIDALWTVFAEAIYFAGQEDDGLDEGVGRFAAAYDAVSGRKSVGWNLTMGLYWIRPWTYPSLDLNSRNYIARKLGLPLGRHGVKQRSNADDYLALQNLLNVHFREADYPAHSFPELSLAAWHWTDPTVVQSPAAMRTDEGDSQPHQQTTEMPDDEESTLSAPPIVAYSVADILQEGCFLDNVSLEAMLVTLRRKKNLILQGPPGTGKTWLARRLAYALMQRKDEGHVRAVQFHPNLSYEDFVRGWRPCSDASGRGQLALTDGVFMNAITAAKKDAEAVYVVIIEEFNRGNPAQIFGELLTLLEASKRSPNEALELCYPNADGTRCMVHIPSNLYVIGTMNIADRSLALMDMALRRRFAFVDLEPCLNQAWHDWMCTERGFTAALLDEISRRINALNQEIKTDQRLGKQFLLGHSFVTPEAALLEAEQRDWFLEVVRTQIGPLLDEYWYDNPTQASKATEKLLAGF